MEKVSEISSTFEEEDDKAEIAAESNIDIKQGTTPIIKEGEILLKVLVPTIAASVILGRRGQSVKYLQRDTKASISFNRGHDYYPGTTDRACLIIGSVLSVRAAHDHVVDKMSDVSGASGKLTVKLLVPNSTVGMVIGKNGEYIKRIKDSTRTYIQVSQKSADRSLLERCITVAGDCGDVKRAVDFIIDKIAADPNSASCPSINYSETMTALPSVRPTGSPYAERGSAATSTDDSSSTCVSNRDVKPAVNSLYTHNIASHPTLDLLKSELRLKGFNDQSAGDVLAAVYTLASYGLLQLHSVSSDQSGEGASIEIIANNTPFGGLEARKRTHEFNDMSNSGEKRVCRGTNKTLSSTCRSGEENMWTPEQIGWHGGEMAFSGSQGYANNALVQSVDVTWQHDQGPGVSAKDNIINESSQSVYEAGQNNCASGWGYENYNSGEQWTVVGENNVSNNVSYENNNSVPQTYPDNSQANSGQLIHLNYWQPNNSYSGYPGNYQHPSVPAPPPLPPNSFPVPPNYPPVVSSFSQNIFVKNTLSSFVRRNR